MRPYYRLMLSAALVLLCAGVLASVILAVMGFAFGLIMDAVFGVDSFPTAWVVQLFAAVGFFLGSAAMFNEMTIPARWTSFKAHFMYA